MGEVGEIYVRSPHMAKGYVGLPDQTAAKFLVNPFTNAEHDRLCVPPPDRPPLPLRTVGLERRWRARRLICAWLMTGAALHGEGRWMAGASVRGYGRGRLIQVPDWRPRPLLP